jgi:hypothetical protein
MAFNHQLVEAPEENVLDALFVRKRVGEVGDGALNSITKYIDYVSVWTYMYMYMYKQSVETLFKSMRKD